MSEIPDSWNRSRMRLSYEFIGGWGNLYHSREGKAHRDTMSEAMEHGSPSHVLGKEFGIDPVEFLNGKEPENLSQREYGRFISYGIASVTSDQTRIREYA